MNYGQKIAELRKGNNLTQAELGAKLNITAQAVSKWENNLSEPDIDSIRRMCEIFNVSVDEFLGLRRSIAPVEIIEQRCEKCGKIINSENGATLHFKYNSAPYEMVEQTPEQHNYCKDCKQYISNLLSEQENNITLAKVKKQKDIKNNFFIGLYLGLGVFAVIGLCLLICVLTGNKVDGSAIFACLIPSTLIPQLIWNSKIQDLFLFFCRSFHNPFNFIIDFSLEGFIGFIVIKIAIWIFCLLLSVIIFIFGIFVCLFASIPLFPFSLVSQIKMLKRINNKK